MHGYYWYRYRPPVPTKKWVGTLGPMTGALAQPLEDLDRTLTGTVEVVGTLDQTLDGVSLSATGAIGDLQILGALEQTLDGLARTVTGTVDVVGTIAPTLDGLALSATGTVGADLLGALTQVLHDLARTLTGTVDVVGSLTKTLDGIGLVANDGAPEAEVEAGLRYIAPRRISVSLVVRAPLAVAGGAARIAGDTSSAARPDRSRRGSRVTRASTVVRDLEFILESLEPVGPAPPARRPGRDRLGGGRPGLRAGGGRRPTFGGGGRPRYGGGPPGRRQ